jgi:hypothetical protein
MARQVTAGIPSITFTRATPPGFFMVIILETADCVNTF